MITKKDALKDLTHERGGNGYAVVQWLPDHPDYCRVVGVHEKGVGTQAFLAWTKLLSPTLELRDPTNPKSSKVEKMLPPKAAQAAQELAADLETGRKVVRQTHIESV